MISDEQQRDVRPVAPLQRTTMPRGGPGGGPGGGPQTGSAPSPSPAGGGTRTKNWVQLSQLRVKRDLIELASQRFTCPHASTSVEVGHAADDDDDHHHHHLLRTQPQQQQQQRAVGVGETGGRAKVTMAFSGGYYAGGTFVLAVDVPRQYPFKPPRVRCVTRVWHPNVDLATGHISHPLLDTDWRPVQSMNAVVLGLQLLFLEPNPEFAANPVAARTYVESRDLFAAQVRQTLRGGHWFGADFPEHRQQGCSQHHSVVFANNNNNKRSPLLSTRLLSLRKRDRCEQQQHQHADLASCGGLSSPSSGALSVGPPGGAFISVHNNNNTSAANRPDTVFLDDCGTTEMDLQDDVDSLSLEDGPENHASSYSSSSSSRGLFLACSSGSPFKKRPRLLHSSSPHPRLSSSSLAGASLSSVPVAVTAPVPAFAATTADAHHHNAQH